MVTSPLELIVATSVLEELKVNSKLLVLINVGKVYGEFPITLIDSDE
jgi:hypothetical protein